MNRHFPRTIIAVLVSSLGAHGLMSGSAHAQIVAYRSAPGTQRATVLNAGNGVPLVNIQTPSAAGVSRNTYSQFDIDEKGAILNNSRQGAATRLAGKVAGNPWLAKGTAKVILNEVVSGNASQLRGTLEVAGDRAEVVIANPAGVDIDGGRFINASRVTVATGMANLKGGAIDHYEVTQGTVTVGAAGMDASEADYAAILARAVKLNGAIVAKELRVVAGANQISSDHKEVTRINGTGPAPEYLLDVAELGGMYAGKITLVGTEAGVGVRNAGQIVTNEGEFFLSIDGKITNTGLITTKGNVATDARGGLENKGTIYAQGDLSITTRSLSENFGLIGAQGNATLKAAGDTGDFISLAGSALIAGLMPDGGLADSGKLFIEAGHRVQASGTNRAGESLIMAGPSIGIWGSDTSAPIVRLEVIPNSTRRSRVRREASGKLVLTDDSGEGLLDATDARIAANELDIAVADGLLRTDNATVQAGRIDIAAGGLSNRGGSIEQLGAGTLVVRSSGYVDSTDGRIVADDRLAIADPTGADNPLNKTLDIANSRGSLEAGVGLIIDAATLSRDGSVVSYGDFSASLHGDFVHGGAAALSTGAMMRIGRTLSPGIPVFDETFFEAAGGVSLNFTGTVTNSTTWHVDGGIAVTAADIVNTGEISSNGFTVVKATEGSLTNRGLIQGKDLIVLGTSVDNQGGRIVGETLAGDLSGNFIGSGGTIDITRDADIRAAGNVTLDQATFHAGGNLWLAGGKGIDIRGGSLAAGQELRLNSQGNITVTGDIQHSASADGNRVRDTSTATTLSGSSINLHATGEASDIQLTHVDLKSTGKIGLYATGDVSIDPGVNYSYDYWVTTKTSRKWYGSKKTTITEHLRESTTILASTITGGELEIAALGDVTLTAAQLDLAGDSSIRAGGDLDYLAAQNKSRESTDSKTKSSFLGFTYSKSSDSHRQSSRSALVTEIQSEADVLSQSDGNSTFEGTHISARGDVTLLAGQNLTIKPVENNSSVLDEHREWRVADDSLAYSLDHKQGSENSQTTTTLTKAQIDGATVTLAANGNIHVTAADITGRQGLAVVAGGNLLIDGAQTSQTRQSEQWESGHGFARVRTDGRDHIVGANYNTEDLNAANTVVTHVGSQLSGGSGNLRINGEGDVAILGSQLEAGQDMQVRAGQNLLLGGGQSGTSESRFKEKGTFVGKMRDGSEQELTHRQVEASFLQAGGNIELSAGGQLTLGAVDIKSGGKTTLATPELILQPEKTSDYANQAEWDKDRGYGVQKGEGRIDETLAYATIDAQGGLVIPDTTRIRLHLDPGRQSQPSQPATQYRDLVDQLASQPGLGYLNDLAGRDDIDWQAIEAAHDQWDYKHEGLTKEGAIVLTIVVAYFTAGAGSSMATTGTTTTTTATTGSAVSGTAAGTTTTATTWGGAALSTTTAGVTQYTALGAALNAGFTSLATTAAVSFANNGGDVGKTLKDLGSKESVRNTVAAMITAGAVNAQIFGAGENLQSLNQFANVSTTPGIGSIGAFNWNSFGQNLAGMAGRSLISATVDNAVNGGDFSQSLRDGFVADLAAVGANGIGTQWGNGRNPFLQTAAHGLLGCAAAEARGGDCKSGAVGGMTESMLGNVLDRFGGVANSNLGKGLYTGAALITSSIVADELDLDTATAMGAAKNAATNNYLSHQENKERHEAAKACKEGNDTACAKETELNALDKQRDADFHEACDGQSSSALCRAATKDMYGNLATYADPKLKTEIGEGKTGSEELAAHRDELQSYVPLMAVGDQTVFNSDKPVESQIPTLYNSDPYAVLSADKNGLYVTAKFGNEWMAVGSTGKVFTNYGGLNGIQNTPDYAPGLIGAHVNQVNSTTGLYTLYYTPTHGFFKDGVLVYFDKMGFTTDDAKNFSKVLAGVQAGGQSVTWVAHSRGGVTFAEGARITEGDLSKNWVVFHAGANNQWVTSGILEDRKIKLGDPYNLKPDEVIVYRDSPYDAVPNIIGFNGNPLDMFKSLLASPLLFAGPERSPHTMPHSPPAAPSPAARSERPLPVMFIALEGVTP